MIKSLWHTNTSSEIRVSKISTSDKTRIKLKSAYSMVSLGTERSVINKNVPLHLASYMAVPYMQGDFSLPIKYGYALSGTLNNGLKAHVMHPHQDLCFINENDLFTDCQNLPSKRIPLISNIETVINAIWDSELEADNSVVICGFGNLGSLLATTLKHYFNVNPKIIEPNLWRQQKAKELGFNIYEENSGFDIAFNTSANKKALQFCINNTNEEGKIIEMSWYGNSEVTLNLGGNFHKNRIRIISTQVSKIPLKMREEFDYIKRKKLATTILMHESFDDLLTIIPFNKSPEFFNAVRKGNPINGLIYLLKY